MRNIIYNDDLSEYIKQNNVYFDDIASDDVLTQAYADINAIFDDLKNALLQYDNSATYEKIYCVASFGLWYGRKNGSKYFNNLYDALLSCLADGNIIYFKKSNTTLMLEAFHHDGKNIFKYYKVINGKKRAIVYDDLLKCF